MKVRDFDKYKVSSLIGEGSFGQVYKGINKTTGEEVALKFITKKYKKPKDIANLRQQVDVLRKINHINVIAFKDFLQTTNQIIIVTEYAGGDLARVLEKQKKINEEKLRKYAKQMLSAMLELKAKRIMHRDLKPQNILIKDDQLKICDFGFAKKMSASTSFLLSLKGTPLYVAPQILSEKPYTFKVDVWSFGIIIFELFTGMPPFYAKTPQRLHPKILRDQVKYPPNMSVQLRQLISSILQKNPIHRPDWQDLCNHPFFKQDQKEKQVLKQITPNVESIIKIKGQICEKIEQQQEEIKIANSKVILRIDGDNQKQQIIRIQKQLLQGTINSQQLKTNIIFYHKIISVLSTAYVDSNLISEQIILKIFKIITYLITRVQLPEQKNQDDITKNLNLLISVIKITQNQKNWIMLEQQYMMIGYLLKNNYNGIQIDFETDQQIRSLVTNSLNNKNLPLPVLNNCIKVIGILASQAIITLSHSQEFFVQVATSKLLPSICQWYSYKQQYHIILQCIQKFIHPIMDCEITLNKKMKQVFINMKEQVAQSLLLNGFITNISPIFLYGNRIAQFINYNNILLQCLWVSSKMREQFMKYQYWNGLLSQSLTKIYCLTYNYIMIHQQNNNFLTNEMIHNDIIKEVSDSKLINVYLVYFLNFNFKKKKPSEQKNRSGRTILKQICDLLMIDQKLKNKACGDLFGCCNCYHFFDDILIEVYCDIISGEHANSEQIISTGKNILVLILGNQNNVEIRLSKVSLYKILKILSYYPQIKTNKIYLRNISNLFLDMLKKQSFQFFSEKYGKQFLSLIMDSIIFLINIDEKTGYYFLVQAQGCNLHRIIFAQQYINQKQLCLTLQLACKMIPKCNKETLDYFAIQVIPKLKKFFSNTNPELILYMIQLASLLAKSKQGYYQILLQFNIVPYIPYYLIEQCILIKQKCLYLIGNFSKFSSDFFNSFETHKIIPAIQSAVANNKSNKKILKNAIYAIGNISFYNERFLCDIKPLVPLLAEGLYAEDEHTILNTISTFSNLLRHSNNYLKVLMDSGVIDKVLKIIIKSNKEDQQLSISLNLLKKALNYEEFISNIDIESLSNIYNRIKIFVKPDNECLRKLKIILNKT